MFFKDPKIAENHSNCPLGYTVDSQQHFFLKAEDRRSSIDEVMCQVLSTFRDSSVDKPDLHDMIVESVPA